MSALGRLVGESERPFRGAMMTRGTLARWRRVVLCDGEGEGARLLTVIDDARWTLGLFEPQERRSDPMANFLKDNEDLCFYMDRGINWDPLVRLTERETKDPDGFTSTEEAVTFYLSLIHISEPTRPY